LRPLRISFANFAVKSFRLSVRKRLNRKGREDESAKIAKRTLPKLFSSLQSGLN
jgi:hypothetical protein